jgi:dihydrodipicolinate synthase/N-acetylneuraminate lyase
MPDAINPPGMLKPRRKILGISAVLLPFSAGGDIDWPAFAAHVERTAAVGLTPSVSMDTGHVARLSEEQKFAVLKRTREVLAGHPFAAGAHVGDRPGAGFDRAAYFSQIEPIVASSGTPVIFPSHGLNELPDAERHNAYAEFARFSDRFIAFELSPAFAPSGTIYSLEFVRGLMGIRQCVGLKHSSLERGPEWERLRLRDEVRPDFQIFTGNDLAIDMVMYGSDYLLGLSTFAPDFFALRDKFWAEGDPAFYEVNDLLQYLGRLAFRDPVPAYKHSAAMFLKLRGWINNDDPLPGEPARPESDRALLRQIVEELGAEVRS